MSVAIALDVAKFLARPDEAFMVRHAVEPTKTKTFTYNDPRWFLIDLLRANQNDSYATLNFDLIRPWLRKDAKGFISTEYLEENASLSAIRRSFFCLRHVSVALEDLTPEPDVRGLSRRHAKRVVSYLEAAHLSTGYCADVQTLCNALECWIIEHYEAAQEHGLDFSLELPVHLRKKNLDAFSTAVEKFLEREAIQSLLDASAQDEMAFTEFRKLWLSSGEFRRDNGFSHTILLRRAIYAQATKLAICVGKRSIALSDLPLDMDLIEGEHAPGKWGVRIVFEDTKILNDEDPVVCFGPYGDIAVDAVEKARLLTSLFRGNYEGSTGGRALFILPESGTPIPARLTNSNLNEYWWNRTGTGLTQRYRILDESGEPRRLTTHNFRTTHETNLLRGGASVDAARRAANHRDAQSTTQFYLVNGDLVQLERLSTELQAGSLKGVLVESPPTVLAERIGPRHAAYWAARGRRLTPTKFGYCALLEDEGPCITSEDCVAANPESGEPCVHHVLSSAAIPALEDDIAIVLYNIDWATKEGWDAWLENQENLLGVLTRTLEEAKDLHQRELEFLAFRKRFGEGLPVLNRTPTVGLIQ